MSEHLEESVGEAMTEKMNEAIHHKQPNNEDDSSSSSSDSETNEPSFSSRVNRAFGRQKPVHTVLGGGKRPLIHVAFGENEQPVGPNSSKFCTDIGRAVRTHISPTHNRWPDVPTTDIDRLWEGITAMYDVSISHRSWVVKKANSLWRDWKHTLRHKFYDKYPTDAERKSNVPSHVKLKDWERFVDMCSTPAAQELRGKGKRVRDALKSPHTSGRKGQARVAEELKSQNPTQELSRTHLYVATHTKKDGSSSEQIALIRKLLEADPSSALMDIDHDPVSVVMGRDSRGCVRGLGLGVSRTSLTISAPYRDSLADSQATYASLTSKVEDLSHCLETMSEKIDRMSAMLERRGTCMPPPTNIEGSSEATLSASPPAQPSPKAACRLMHLQRGSTCVAEGSILCVSSQDEALFSVIIDEVFVDDCILIDREGTFADIEIGETITWPRFRTVLVESRLSTCRF